MRLAGAPHGHGLSPPAALGVLLHPDRDTLGVVGCSDV
jgi:hypothetical protein